MSDCFVDFEIAGKENQSSILNKDLNDLYPNMDTDLGHELYLAAKNNFNMQLELNKKHIRWDTPEGNQALRDAGYPLDENGEPVLQVDKTGSAFLYNPDKTRFYLKEVKGNSASRLDAVSSIATQYAAEMNTAESLDKFMKDNLRLNFREANSLISSLENENDKIKSELKSAKDSDKPMMKSVFRKNNEKIDELISAKEFITMTMKSKMFDVIKKEVSSVLKQMKLREFSEEDMEDDDTSNMSLVDLSNIKNSNEINSKAYADPQVLRLLSSIPKKRYESGPMSSKIYTKSKLLPANDSVYRSTEVWAKLAGITVDLFPKFMDAVDEANVNQLDKESLSHTDFYNVIKDQINEYAQRGDLMMESFAEQLEDTENSLKGNKNDIEAFKVKMATAFFLGRNIFIKTVFDRPGSSDKRGIDIDFNIIPINSREEKINDQTEELFDVAVMTMFNKIKSGESSVIDNLTKSANIGKSTLIRDAESLQKTVRDLTGISISDEEALALDEIMPKDNDGQKDYNAFLNGLINPKSISDFMSEIGYKESYAGMSSLIHFAKNNSNGAAALSYFQKEQLKRKFINNNVAGNSFMKIARAQFTVNPSLQDENVVVSGKKRYSSSLNSKLKQDVVKLRQGDVTLLNDLKNTGNRIAKYLLADEIKNNDKRAEESQKRLGRFGLVVNTEISENESSDNYELSEATVEDLMLNMFAMYGQNDAAAITQGAEHSNTTGNTSLAVKQERATTDADIGYHVDNTKSDKKQSSSFTGIKRKRYDFDVNPKDPNDITGVGEELKKDLKNYFIGELEKIGKENQVIDSYLKGERVGPDGEPVKMNKAEKRAFLLANLTPDWHFKTKKDVFTEELDESDFLGGNYKKFGFWNEFYADNKDEIDNTVFENSASHRLSNIANEFMLNDEMNKNLQDYFLSLVEEEYKKISDLNFLKSAIVDGDKVSDKKLGELSSNINQDGVVKGEKEYMYEFIANTVFNNIDIYNMFNGEIGNFKQKGEYFNMADPLKRSSATHFEGLTQRNRDAKEVAYYTPFGSNKKVPFLRNSNTVFAVVKDVEYDESEYSDAMSYLLKKVESGRGKNDDLDMSGNVAADGMSWGNPEFLYRMYDNIYGFNDNDKKLHSELMKPDTKVTIEHMNFLRRLAGSNQSAKITGYTKRKTEQGSSTALYYKSSTLPLYAALTTGFPIDNLRKLMNNKGVDIIATDSSIKSVKPVMTSVHNDSEIPGRKGMLKEYEDMDLNPFLIDAEDLKIQVELSSKGEHEANAGIQPMSNILANMDLDNPEANYEFDGKRLTAKQMYAEVDKTVKDNIQYKVDEFMSQVRDRNGNVDYELMRNLVISQLDKDLDAELIKLLKDPSNPIESAPEMEGKAFAIFSSKLTKDVAKPSSNAASMIQVADVGFNMLDKNTKSDAIFFGKQGELKPPRPLTANEFMENLDEEDQAAFAEAIAKQQANDKKYDPRVAPLYFDEQGTPYFDKAPGRLARIQKAQIMMPFSSLFENSGMTWEEFKTFMQNADENNFDQEIFKNIMGYRIPNQAMSSNDSFEVVGILPPSSGDIAMMYHEITYKTGSDFDIDKMYLMMPHFSVDYKIEKPKLTKSQEEAKRNIVKNTLIEDFMENNFGSLTNAILQMSKDEDVVDFIEKNIPGEKTDSSIASLLYKKQEEFKRITARSNKIRIVDADGKVMLVREAGRDIVNAVKQRDLQIKKAMKTHGIDNYSRRLAEKFSYINDNSMEGLQNKMIRAYNSIIQSEASFDDLVSPLDNPYLKNSINEVIYLRELIKDAPLEDRNRIISEAQADADFKKKAKEAGAERTPKALRAMMPLNLAKTRNDMLVAKGLVAIMANHMTSIPWAQIQKATVDTDLHLPHNSLHGKYVNGHSGDFNYKITKMVSYFMNASVDAAKDNYIIEGNINSYTSGPAMLLTRMGVDPVDVFKILNNEHVLELSKDKVAQKGIIANINTTDTNSELDAMSEGFKSGFQGKINFDDFLTGNISRENALGYWNMLVKVAEDLNNEITSSKANAKGAGKSIAQNYAMMNKVNALAKSTISYGPEGAKFKGGMLSNEGIEFDPLSMTTNVNTFNPNVRTDYHEDGTYKEGSTLTFPGAIHNASVGLMNYIGRNLLLEKTSGYKAVADNVIKELTGKEEISEDDYKMVLNSMYPYMLRKAAILSGNTVNSVTYIGAKINPASASNAAERQKFEDYNKHVKDEAYYINEFPGKMLALKYDKANEDNLFLKSLMIDPASGSIIFDGSVSRDDILKLSMKEDAESLYVSGNSKTRELMVDLAKYSFFTSGFKQTGTSFHEYIPLSLLKETGYMKDFNSLMNHLNSSEYDTKEDVSEVMKYIAYNNSNNRKIFKSVGKGFKASGLSMRNPENEKIAKRISYLKSEVVVNPLTQIEEVVEKRMFYPFIKTGGSAYMLIDINHELASPVYKKMLLKEDLSFDPKDSGKKRKNKKLARLKVNNLNVLNDNNILVLADDSIKASVPVQAQVATAREVIRYDKVNRTPSFPSIDLSSKKELLLDQQEKDKAVASIRSLDLSDLTEFFKNEKISRGTGFIDYLKSLEDAIYSDIENGHATVSDLQKLKQSTKKMCK